jgi:peptidoglycan/LPS O-acetylase OafA/YrhL
MNLPDRLFKIETDNRRNTGLDLMRAAAICLVMVSHGMLLLPDDVPGSNILFWTAGFWGVELFFILSGFLIGTILIRVYVESDSFGLQAAGSFWIRRWFRTLPNYYLFLLIYLLVTPVEPLSTATRYLFFMQNFLWSCPPFYSASWSLATEEWFYLSLPAGMLMLKFLPMNKKNGLLAYIIGYIFFFTGFRLFTALHFGGDWDEDIRKVVSTRLDAIGYGVLGAYMYSYHRTVVERWKPVLTVTGIGIVLAICAMIVLSVTGSVSYTSYPLFTNVFLFSLASLGILSLLPWFVSAGATVPAVLSYFVAHMSAVSYSIYLVHQLVILLLASVIPSTAGVPWIAVRYLLFWITTVWASTLLYNYFEKPATGLRDRVSKKETHAAI